ncbi:MAG TPA: methyltransferase domain-containing protein [Pseudolabrys sp.]|nr:methyltransferase domain-containing protein [Pseudolabrys sp.]
MNRKERRAALKQQGRRDLAPAAPDLATLTAQARERYDRGQFGEARDACLRILEREPSHVPSLNLLGIMAQASDRHQVAVKNLSKALAIDPQNAACHYNIANSLERLGRRAEAIGHFKKAIALGDAGKLDQLLMQSPTIADYVERIGRDWPIPVKSEELFATAAIDTLASDLFLRCVLETTILRSAALELLLGHARLALLRLASATTGETPDDDVGAFLCALAQQCFLNEYVLAQNDEEIRLVAQLRDLLVTRIAGTQEIPALLLAAVAAYVPLHVVPGAEQLLQRQWPASVAGLLQQQVREPLEEIRDRHSIPALTMIDNTSLPVLQQYEENPYPRWTINPLAAFAADRAAGRIGDGEEQCAELDILIAGCGTGQHPIQAAQRFPNARLLAFDISLPSLAYARRKTRELGLRNIEYAQADILQLAAVKRRFDRIEAIGVLHHLEDPNAGWRALLSLLRPNGEMLVGLYSELARRIIVDAREFIAQNGYRAAPDDIRKFRSEVIHDRHGQRWKPLLAAKDFYSMSGCRDLLFNAMEHRYSIAQIAAFLEDNKLSFLGFELDDPLLLEKFKRVFTEPDALTKLANWETFERANPDTFSGMYVFSVRKN